MDRRLISSFVAAALFAALPWAFPAAGNETVAGVASVIDGDTLEIHGQRIRLHGVDAPESRQTCLDAIGKEWRCGQEAALKLADHIGRAPIICERRDIDRYGRIVGRCSVTGSDINAWLVSEGWAVAYRQYSTDYVGQEDAAKAFGPEPL